MELLLNLVWVALSCTSLLVWALWRRTSNSESMPGMLRGILVLTCILALLFPVISMSDDLSQAAVLAEGNKLQDVLKSPVSRQFVAIVLLYTITALAAPVFRIAFDSPRSHGLALSLYDSFSAPGLAKRPPPRLL